MMRKIGETKGTPETIEEQVGQHKLITYKNYNGKAGPINESDESKTNFNKLRIIDTNSQDFVFGGKCQGILLDNVKKVQVQVAKVISSIEIANCENVKIYVQEACPTISIDGCSNVHVYLWDVAKEAQVVTSKSSETNVSVQVGDEFKEMALPEQFVHKFDAEKKIMTCAPTEQLGV